MIFASAFFSALNTCIRYVDHLPTMEIVFFRSIGTVLCCIIIIMRKKIPLVVNSHKMLILRSIFGVTAMALFYKTLQIMPIGSAVSLRYVAPLFATILALYILKEKVKNLQWVFFLTALVGVFLLKGFDARLSTFAVSLAMLTALVSSFVYIIIRKIGDTEHPLIIVSYFMVFTLFVGGIFSIGNWVQPVGNEWYALLILGLFGFGGQLFMTQAFQLEETNIIAPFRYTEVVFTLLFGWILYGEYQTLASLGAMLIIVLSLVANVWAKRRT